MMILIDGYNLLHVTGLSGPEITRREIAVGALERARNALLNFLATALDEGERRMATVVFDSNDAPPGLPHETNHRGITVKYATEYASADELLEELIRESTAPRRLTVVSSDHRVQRAARRRKARAVDSDVWYADIRDSRHRPDSLVAVPPRRPAGPLSDEEVAAWLAEFGDVHVEDLLPSASAEKSDGSAPSMTAPIENPFPPGYAEDVIERE